MMNAFRNCRRTLGVVRRGWVGHRSKPIQTIAFENVDQRIISHNVGLRRFMRPLMTGTVDKLNVDLINGTPRMTLSYNGQERAFIFLPNDKLNDVYSSIKAEFGDDIPVSCEVNGQQISEHTSLAAALRCPFTLRLQNVDFKFDGTTRGAGLNINDDMVEIKEIVLQLYDTLDVHGYRRQTVEDAEKKLEELEQELEPMRQKVAIARQQAKRRTRMVVWGGLGLMGAQFGILARLTWYDYSWDIVEPLTYFITFGTAMASYCFFALTSTDYEYRGAFDRKYIQYLHNSAKRQGLDVDRYNEMLESVEEAKKSLDHLRRR